MIRTLVIPAAAIAGPGSSALVTLDIPPGAIAFVRSISCAVNFGTIPLRLDLNDDDKRLSLYFAYTNLVFPAFQDWKYQGLYASPIELSGRVTAQLFNEGAAAQTQGMTILLDEYARRATDR